MAPRPPGCPTSRLTPQYARNTLAIANWQRQRPESPSFLQTRPLRRCSQRCVARHDRENGRRGRRGPADCRAGRGARLRHEDAAAGTWHVAAAWSNRSGRCSSRARGRLPAHRHGNDVRQRNAGRAGDRGERRAPSAALRDNQVAAKPHRTRTGDSRGEPRCARSGPCRPVVDPLAARRTCPP